MTRITGRQARELLDGTTPGPWQAYDPGDGTARLYGDMKTCHHPDEDEDGRGVRLFHSTNGLVPAHAMVYMERRDGLLAVAAPDLAETVIWLYGRIREIHNDQRVWADAYRAPVPDDPWSILPDRAARAEAHDDCADMLQTLLDDEEAQP